MKWYKNKILKKLFLNSTDWNVAWKKKNEDKYIVIDNPDGYWLADSLLFSDSKNIYLFVEAFEKKSSVGRLGVLIYNGKEFTDFQIILEQKYHLSYPYVFKHNEKYFMIPETSENNTIELYIAIEFPNKWEKVTDLANGKYVDTTLYQLDKNIFKFYTYEEDKKIMSSGTIDMNKYLLTFQEKKYDKKHILRAGGNVFKKNNNYYRAEQNNEFFYGQSLKIVNCNDNECIYELHPLEIKTNKNNKYRRLHTYSIVEQIEAIDLSNFKFDIIKPIKKMRNLIWKD